MKESIHYLLMADHFMFQKNLLCAIKDTDLTPGQPKVLDYLRNHDGVVQKEIAAACHIEPASLTSILLGMEQNGLVTRKMLNGNRRSLHVFLTNKGKEMVSILEMEFDAIEAKALKGFSEEEKETLTTLLSKVYVNIHEKE